VIRSTACTGCCVSAGVVLRLNMLDNCTVENKTAGRDASVETNELNANKE